MPRAKDIDLVTSIVRAVREAVGPEAPLHVFGLGKAETVAAIIEAGADSTDSSSYARMAADGALWDGRCINDPSPVERMHLALANYAHVAGTALPLSLCRSFETTTTRFAI